MKVLEDNKKYTDNGELKSHTITIELNSSNLSDAIYAIVCVNEFYCDKENKPIDFISKQKQRLDWSLLLGYYKKN